MSQHRMCGVLCLHGTVNETKNENYHTKSEMGKEARRAERKVHPDNNACMRYADGG